MRPFHSSQKSQVKQWTPPKKLSIRALQPQRLLRGGKLIVVPFRAGEDAVATKELDHLALTIVKGMADGFLEMNSNIVVVASRDANEADFIMNGYIDKF